MFVTGFSVCLAGGVAAGGTAGLFEQPINSGSGDRRLSREDIRRRMLAQTVRFHEANHSPL